jgi:hypothetical protein
MSDRELLQLAAKAAGGSCAHRRRLWNPLTDDGDAMRLAVKLRFHIYIFSASEVEGISTPGFVEIRHRDSDPLHTEYVNGGNYKSATRRAIVRAAAEIGRRDDLPK